MGQTGAADSGTSGGDARTLLQLRRLQYDPGLPFAQGGPMNRREMLTGFAGVLAFMPSVQTTQTTEQRQMKPLPLDPTKLRGLSEKLLRSHYDNNYAGAFRRLGQIETMIAA